MIKVMLLEDEPQIRLILKKMIEKNDGFEVVAEADNFTIAMQEYMKFRPDIVFVDVDLKGESGLDCAKIMVDINPKLKVIFATAHSEYMANAFEIYAFDYLVKPFDLERVTKTLSRIKGSFEEEKEPQSIEGDKEKLLIKGKEQLLFVDKKDIVMIERIDGTTEITTKEEVYRTSTSLTELEQKLAGDFMRSHKSYIINVSKISKVEPYGRWTYVVKFKGIDGSALITAAKYEELKERFS